MNYEEEFKRRKSTVEKNRQRWEEMGRPFEILKKGSTVIIDGEFRTFQGFIGNCTEENIIVDRKLYSGRGVNWEKPEKAVTLADSTLQNLDLHVYKTSGEKRKAEDMEHERILEEMRRF